MSHTYLHKLIHALGFSSMSTPSTKLSLRPIAMAVARFHLLIVLTALILSLTPPTSSSRSAVSSLHKLNPRPVLAGGNNKFPPACERIECPKFDVLSKGNGYEVRRYNFSEWMSTPAIEEISLVDATRAGFLMLFDYIQGKNDYEKKIEMTAPVLTEVSPSDGPFCASSFVISFYVPQVNQENPPPAKGLHVQKWDTKYVAVRQFGGFVSDDNVGIEAAALYRSLSDSGLADAVQKGQSADGALVYTVAQYNSPFEFTNRVNEIWITLDPAKFLTLAL